MPSASLIQALPAEIVCQILSQLSLQDILNFAATCKHFYRMGQSNRAFWTDSAESHLLPLPTGETARTVDVTSLSRLATRACTLKRLWNGVAEPRVIRPVQTIATRPIRGLLKLESAAILPGGEWALVLIKKRLYLLRLDGKEQILLPNHGDAVDTYSWDASHGAQPVMLAILARTLKPRGEEDENFLCILSLQFSRDAPVVEQIVYVQLSPFTFAQHVDLHGNMCVLSGGAEILVYNWLHKTGTKIQPILDEIHEDSETEAFLHPSLPLIMFEKCSPAEVYTLFAMDLPTTASASDCEESDWPVIQQKCIASREMPGQSCARAFRQLGQGVWSRVLDVFIPTTENTNFMYSYEVLEPAGALEALTNDTKSTEGLSSFSTADNRHLGGDVIVTLDGKMHDLTGDDARVWEAVFIPVGRREGPAVTTLPIPPSLSKNRTRPIAFDSTYGLLLVLSAEAVYLLEY